MDCLDLRVPAVVLDHLHPEGAHGFRHEDFRSARDPCTHPEGGAPGGGAVVHREPGHLHADQVRQHAHVLEHDLEPAHVRVVAAGVGGQELPTVDDRVDHRRDVVLVAAGAEEAQVFLTRLVLRQDSAHMPLELELGEEGLREIERPSEPKLLRYLDVQLFHVLHPCLLQHLRPCRGHGIRDVGVDNRSLLRHRIGPPSCGWDLSHQDASFMPDTRYGYPLSWTYKTSFSTVNPSSSLPVRSGDLVLFGLSVYRIKTSV